MKPNSAANWSDMYGGNCSGEKPISGQNNIIVYDSYGWNYNTGTISANERLRVFAWSKDWLKPATYSSCRNNTDLSDADENSNGKIDFIEDWEDAGSKFDALGEDVKYVLSKATASPDADNVEQPTVPGTAARYDWIYKKYTTLRGWTLNNWADRTIA